MYGFGRVSFFAGAGAAVVIRGADLGCVGGGRRVGIGIIVELALLLAAGLTAAVEKGSVLIGRREGVRLWGDSVAGIGPAEAS